MSCNNLQIAVSFLAVERCKTFLLLAYGVIPRWIDPVHWDSGWIRLLFSPKPATATFLLFLLLLLLAPPFVYIPAFASVIATARRNCWLGFSSTIATIAATIAISSCCGLGGFLACGLRCVTSSIVSARQHQYRLAHREDTDGARRYGGRCTPSVFSSRFTVVR